MSGAESDRESRAQQDSTPLHFESIAGVGDRIRGGEISSVALTRYMLGRIEAHNARLNAYIEVTAELALRQAHRADSELAQGQDRGRLHGAQSAQDRRRTERSFRARAHRGGDGCDRA